MTISLWKMNNLFKILEYVGIVLLVFSIVFIKLEVPSMVVFVILIISIVLMMPASFIFTKQMEHSESAGDRKSVV